MSAITAWATEVHPGTPAPYSPHQSPSVGPTGRRSSFSRFRRVSASSGRMRSASFASFSETLVSGNNGFITPFIKDFAPDLTAMGYTSVFIHYPETPLSPPKAYCVDSNSYTTPYAAPVDTAKQVKPKHLKGISSHKKTKRTRSITPPSPLVTGSNSSSETKRTNALQTTTVAKTKKPQHSRKFHPAPLANDLILAQLMDGGKIEDHVKNYAEAHAKANGAAKHNGQLLGVGDVWRDEEGGAWMDEDEVWEFTHLLSGDDDFCLDEVEWVQFGSNSGRENKLLELDSRQSLSTQDSDLSPRYAMKVEADCYDDLAKFSTDSAALVKPGLTVLAIPARSRRTAKHLRKPEFLLNAFPVPRSPVKATDAPLTPRSPRAFPVSARGKGRTRRRPTPLNLMPASPAFKQPLNPADTDQMRMEFLQDSFRPRPRRGRARQGCQSNCPTNTETAPDSAPQPAAPQPRKIIATKSSMANLKGFFRAIGVKKSNAA
jgi:hypothetical protein